MKVSLGAQIEEVMYELEMRATVYPRLVAQHKMRESVAAMHSERMDAVMRTLLWLQTNEKAVRDAVASTGTASEV
jgi:hypothetical protein